tara:strand:- start:69 stop:245 length:177 start_codon:yes stop_codon:yes gene_type:complete
LYEHRQQAAKQIVANSHEPSIRKSNAKAPFMNAHNKLNLFDPIISIIVSSSVGDKWWR